MPNTLTSIFTSSPATEPVEAPHPNTGVYVLGTQAVAGGTWAVVHTNVTKTATAPTMVGRLKNYPAVTASIVASGNVLNNILATPTGTSATGTSGTSINVVVSSIANQTAYRLLASDTVGGTYAQIYQGSTASFAHTGLTAGQTKYYQWQYVGGGFYDDSALSAVFSGTAAAPAKVADVVLWVGQSNDSGLSPRTGLAAAYFNADTRIKSWDKTTATAGTYSLGTIGGDGNPLGANDHAITKAIVPSYDNGIGPDVGFVKAWKDDAGNAGKELFVFKIDLTPPASTNGKSIEAWLRGTDGVAALFPDFLSQWQALLSWLTTNTYTLGTRVLFCGIGEQDSVNYLSSSTGGTNPDFAASLTEFFARFLTNSVLASTSRVFLAQKQRPGTASDATIAAAQAAYAQANNGTTRLLVLSSPTFLAVDGTHYTQDAMLRLGALEYQAYSGQLATTAAAITDFTPASAGTSGSGALITVTGAYLTGATAVRVGGVAVATYTVVSATQVTFQTASGMYSGRITIVTPAGTAVSANVLSIGDVPNATFGAFTSLAFTPLASGVTLASGAYRTSARSGNWAPGGLTPVVLPASTIGGLATTYDGSAGRAVFGFSFTNAYRPGFEMDYGFYFDPLAGGGHGLRLVNGAVAAATLLKTAVLGARYQVYRYLEAGATYRIGVWESTDGAVWNLLTAFTTSGTISAKIFPQFKLLESATAGLLAPTTCGAMVTCQTPGVVLQTFDAPSWNWPATNWVQYINAPDHLGASLYYTSTNNAVATRTLVVPAGEGAVLKFYSNRATGYGTGIVRLDGVQIGAAWSANGPNSSPDAVNPVYVSPVIAPGTYTLTVVNTIVNVTAVQIVIDRSVLTTA